MSKKIYGSKDFFSTFSFIFTGIVVLLGINLGIFFVFVKYPAYRRRFVGFLAIMIWILWRMRRVQKKLWYVFEKKSITIHLPSGKEFVLVKKDIKKEECIEQLSLFSGRWVMYVPWKHELYFTTSTSNILKLTMKDGRIIYLSPKVYPK